MEAIVYAKDKIEFAVQLVDNHIYIEVEDNCDRIVLNLIQFQKII